MKKDKTENEFILIKNTLTEDYIILQKANISILKSYLS